MSELRSARFYVSIAYVIAIWVLIFVCLTYHWQPVFRDLDKNLLEGGQDEIHFVN
jgi:hypothetical protein